MGFIAGFANAGSDAIDRRLGQIQQQEDTAYQLVAQRFLDNSRKRTEANAADEARIRSAHTLAEQAGMPDAWTHAYDMLVAGLTPLQVAAKLDESTFSPFDPNGPEAQQTAPTDATASESTQDAGQPVDLMQQGSQGPNQPASNAVDISTLNPIQNFINTGMGGIFNRANRTSSRMEQMSQQFRTNMGISQEEFDTTMNDTFQPQTMTHAGQLVPKLASGITDYDGVIFVETMDENGQLRTQEAIQNENGEFINPITGNPIEGSISKVRTEEELDAINKLITLTNGQFQDIIDVQDGTLRGISSYMRLGDFFADPNNANILTGTSGVLALVEGLGREAGTLLDAFNDFSADASYNSARDVEDAILHILPEGTRDMVGQRAQFVSLMAGAAYELARSQNGSGVLSNRDIAAAFDQIRGNTTNPVVFMQNLKNLAEKSVENANSTIESAKRLPAIQQMQSQEVAAIQVALQYMEAHMTTDQATWMATPAEDMVGHAPQNTLADDETSDAIDEMLDPSTDEQDLSTVLQRDETTGVTIHRIENMDGGKMAVKYSLDGQNLLVIEVTREELNSAGFYELLVQEANNQ